MRFRLLLKKKRLAQVLRALQAYLALKCQRNAFADHSAFLERVDFVPNETGDAHGGSSGW